MGTLRDSQVLGMTTLANVYGAPDGFIGWSVINTARLTPSCSLASCLTLWSLPLECISAMTS